MLESDIIERIKSLCQARSWTLYRLAKESDITYSTLCTMLRKGNTPSLPTLIKLCKGFGISLCQFFNTDDETATLSRTQRNLLLKWDQLTREDRAAADKFIDYLLQSRSKEPIRKD